MAEEETKEPKPKKRSSCFIVIIGLIVIAVLYFYFLINPTLIDASRSPWESRTKIILRSYSETQSKFMNANRASTYASWDELQEYGYLHEDYTQGNIIGNYSLWTYVDNPTLQKDPEIEEIDPSLNSFVAVAFPRTTSPPGYLATFAITEDQVLRVYKPGRNAREWNYEDIDCIRTWEPIR